MKTLITAVALLFVLGGCASRADYEAFVATFVNRTEAELVRELGVPNRTYEVEGSRFLAYSRSRVDVIDGGYRPGWGAPGWGGPGWGPGYGRRGWGGPGWYDPPVVRESSCETTFEVRDGRVIAWSVRGNACVA